MIGSTWSDESRSSVVLKPLLEKIYKIKTTPNHVNRYKEMV
jgi:hypothetical protein